MKTALLVHGIYGYPEENWFPWIRLKLTSVGYHVVVPQFPTPEHQNLETWLEVVQPYLPLLDEESIVVGHSLGVAFLLTVLERLDQPIRAAFFVAGFAEPINISALDLLLKTFVARQFNWRAIRAHCHQFVVIHSDNDPYVPYQIGQHLAHSLHTRVHQIKGGGHFNQEYGFNQFDYLWQLIQPVVQPSAQAQ